MPTSYFICCEIMRYEIEHILPHIQDPPEIVFVRKGYHDNPAELRRHTQQCIDEAPAWARQVLLGYGICGTGLVGIQARTVPVILPRIHDCISLLLGSAVAYRKHFDMHPGTFYYSPGWVEMGMDSVGRIPSQGMGMGKTYEEYVEKYGEENARYLMEIEGTWAQHYTRTAYIDVGIPDTGGWEAKAQAIAAQNGWAFERVQGSIQFLRALLEGPWDNEAGFLTIPPGHRIVATNDIRIMAIEKTVAF